MSADNLARARAWIEHAIDLMPSGEESVVQACAIALAAAVQAKGEADAEAAGIHPACFMRSATETHIRAHAADVPPPPVTP